MRSPIADSIATVYTTDANAFVAKSTNTSVSVATVLLNPDVPAFAEHRFTEAEHKAFARLSGDFNPLHVDPVAARRLLFGAPVVHGMHGLLWALDRNAAVDPARKSLVTLSVSFPAPIFVDAPVSLSVSNRGAGRLELVMTSGGDMVLSATVRCGDAVETAWAGNVDLPHGSCRILGEDKLVGATGSLSLHFPLEDFAHLFPALARSYTPVQMAVLLATTRLVGMECPGLHSIFSTLRLSFGTDSASEGLVYRVTKWDKRFRLLNIAVSAPGVGGTIGCFVRPAPVVQPSYAEVAARVTPNAFAGETALIVGGSRGVGEVTAKLIAGGGGTALVTYRAGQADAEALAEEINRSGGRCRVFYLDVLAEEMAFEEEGPISSCYYVASPRIRANKGKIFDDLLFQRYCHFYVTAAGRLFTQLVPRAVRDFTFFYPSTIFLETPEHGFGEYTAAKAAGEALCRDLQLRHPSVRIVCPRLPRLRTDQTQGLREITAGDPVEAMLATLTGLQRGRHP